ncbi:hypothetical protein NQD34_017345 [Periophthalmus magnuspinnatus]|nr:hypothetical protein NQD34_017345 [Periophthalmus magnuspinnatus]
MWVYWQVWSYVNTPRRAGIQPREVLPMKLRAITIAAETTAQTQTTGTVTFLTCPEKLTHYCIHGECRYIKEMDVVSCRCHPGFVGARCEFIDFSPRREEKKYIILICAVVGLLLVIVVILIVFLHRKCNLCHKKSRSRNESRNGAEKNHEDTNLKLIADSAEQPNRTNSV